MECIYDFFSNTKNLNVLSGISSIGTFIAALVALFTIRLIKKQIKDSKRPNITVGHSVYGVCHAINDRLLKTIWHSGSDTEGKPEYTTLDYEIINVGVGFAENITLLETFDTKAAIKFIKNIDYNNEFDFNINESYADKVLEIRTKFDSDWDRIYLSMPKRELGNLKPASINNESAKYIFCEEYLAFISCFGYLREKHDRFLSLEKFPTLQLTISFRDIDSKLYKNKFSCSAFCISEDSYSLTIKKMKK